MFPADYVPNSAKRWERFLDTSFVLQPSSLDKVVGK